ncbi:hypothetical protein ACRQ4B_12455 [Curtobacterium sp. SP.BCo]|uniref:hypothetical protein n=1 Tax=Curtobacterium sp. SP.BCo TaxID=3435229 RepID=UPI003F736F1D
MIPRTTRPPGDTAAHFPREIAAAITLPAACAALVAPGADRLPRAAAIAVLTACGALAPRVAIIAFLAARDRPDPRNVTGFDPFSDPTPPALRGLGPSPDRARLRVAGDRCAEAWQRWRADDLTADTATGAAGALATASWCSWALGSVARAQTRAQYALETRADDPLAALVLRSVRAGSGPRWGRR